MAAPNSSAPAIDPAALADTAVEPLLDELAQRLDQYLAEAEAPVIVGIHTGGVWVAEGLNERLQAHTPVGTLEVAFHRDDHATSGMKASVQASDVPLDLDGRTVVLVDDVVHTARTARAAVNALFDYGRPQRVVLTALLDRGGRELPIQPDVVGRIVSMSAGQRIKLRGPVPLRFEVSATERTPAN